MPDFLLRPWPWYITGPLIGLTVPLLLLLGNKHFGISANFRHACAAFFPAGIAFFRYEWKKESWNILFILGILAGGLIGSSFLTGPDAPIIDSRLTAELAAYNIHDQSGLLPSELFSWNALTTLRGFIALVAGGFLVGFGTRYAGGCTSGHAIMGISTLQWPSLVATICFMAGGFLMANVFLPFILKL